MSTVRYTECKTRVEAIHRAYDALADAVDGYVSMLQAILETLPEEQKAHLGLALRMQRDGAVRMRDDLESKILDDLIRFADRVIRVKHAEDGTFI